MEKKKMLLVLNPQVDFITGALPISGASQAMDSLADYVRMYGSDYVVRLVACKWHPYNHSAFIHKGGKLPAHCVQYSVGAAVWQGLLDSLNETKGGFTMLYSGQQVNLDECSVMQNPASADIVLRLIVALEIEQIDICGLPGDTCVLASASDLAQAVGALSVRVLESCTASFDDGTALKSFLSRSCAD